MAYWCSSAATDSIPPGFLRRSEGAGPPTGPFDAPAPISDVVWGEVIASARRPLGGVPGRPAVPIPAAQGPVPPPGDGVGSFQGGGAARRRPPRRRPPIRDLLVGQDGHGPLDALA